jgi:hypothetical protein
LAHLATITSQAENVAIINLAPSAVGSWIGAYQNKASPSFSEPAGGWEWVTGEPWVFSNWGAGEPNDGGGGLGPEDFICVVPNLANAMPWNDCTSFANEPLSYLPQYFIAESSPIDELNAYISLPKAGRYLQGAVKNLPTGNSPRSIEVIFRSNATTNDWQSLVDWGTAQPLLYFATVISRP